MQTVNESCDAVAKEANLWCQGVPALVPQETQVEHLVTPILSMLGWYMMSTVSTAAALAKQDKVRATLQAPTQDNFLYFIGGRNAM